MPNIYRTHWIVELSYVDKLINSAKGHDEWDCCWNSGWEIGVRLFGTILPGSLEGENSRLVIFQLA